MEKKIQKQSVGKLRISTTGYRILFLLKSLIQKSSTIEELVEIVRSNKYIKKSASKDTIRIDINTLKIAGCVIERPSKANGYKYELVSHPFVFNLLKDEFKIFSDLRDNFAKNIPVNEVFILNDLYKKIIELTCNQSQIDFIANSQPLNSLNRKIFAQLSNGKIINRKIQIKYKSPKHGEEDICVIPGQIIYENDKVYLWCYNCKYEGYGLLYIDRILNINVIDMNEQKQKADYRYNVIYELSINNVDNFELKEYETILEKTADKITIDAKVNNEFLFIQRLLQFGSDFKIISPDFFKKKLINKIKLIQKRYK